MKSGRARGTREETGKSGDGGEEGELAKITHKVPEHRRAWKPSPQTCRRLEK